MNIVERAKNICLTPSTEWPVIASEPADTGAIITGYVAPLAAIGAIAGFIGGSIVGFSVPFAGTYRTSMTSGLVMAVFTIVAAIVGVFVLSLVINALAPTFGAVKDQGQAFKVAVYSYTPAWIAGALRILPALGVLGILAALYGLYLLYLGLPRLMKCPEDKAIGYTVVVVVCAIVITAVVAAVGGLIGAGAYGVGALAGGGLGSTAPAATEGRFDPNSPVGKLQQLSDKLAESSKKIDAAQKSGDTGAQAAAALEGLGTLLGGGNRVDPVGIDQLKPFVPATFAGLARKSSNAEKSGIGPLVVSKAEATYGDDAGKRVTLEISDTGGMSGLVALAGWANLQGEKEDDQGTERTTKVDGRLVHEKISKTGGSNEFAVVLGDRFVVEATGNGVDQGQLKSAVGSLDLGKLEAMKGLGVQK